MTPHLSRRALLLASAAAAVAPAVLPGAASAATRAASGAPYAAYWYPDSFPAGTPGPGITWRSLKAWRAEDDADLAFNSATVPLARRFTPVPVNTTARAGQARIQSLVSFGPTAGNPSQGAATADHYALTHWSYLDELVFWGGSSGEGLILAPNAPVVDAAHRHGVPVLGSVFLPPVAYGGDLRWTRDLVQKDSFGRFPLAERLVAVAAAYGFDGWFINAETGGGDAALAADMTGFLKELTALGRPKGLRVCWYDSMTVSGSVSWQGALNDRNKPFFQAADSMFVDFRWSRSTLAASGRTAEQLGRSRYELWAGVDVEANGWNRSVDWDAIIPVNTPDVVSLGFYRPEWTRNHLPAGRTPAQFHAADDRFWSGQSLDPSRPTPGDPWRAPALAVADRSTVDTLPFATVFNTGHGLRWYESGKVTSDAPWNHLGVQDRMPSRQWVVRTTGQRPTVAYDFSDAWHGGSSLLVGGTLTAPTTLDLYACRLPFTADTVVELVHRSESAGVTVELALATGEPAGPGQPHPYTYVPLADPGPRLDHHHRAADRPVRDGPRAGSPADRHRRPGDLAPRLPGRTRQGGTEPVGPRRSAHHRGRGRRSALRLAARPRSRAPLRPPPGAAGRDTALPRGHLSAGLLRPGPAARTGRERGAVRTARRGGALHRVDSRDRHPPLVTTTATLGATPHA